jgi:hypothetical protein
VDRRRYLLTIAAGAFEAFLIFPVVSRVATAPCTAIEGETEEQLFWRHASPKKTHHRGGDGVTRAVWRGVDRIYEERRVVPACFRPCAGKVVAHEPDPVDRAGNFLGFGVRGEFLERASGDGQKVTPSIHVAGHIQRRAKRLQK